MQVSTSSLTAVYVMIYNIFIGGTGSPLHYLIGAYFIGSILDRTKMHAGSLYLHLEDGLIKGFPLVFPLPVGYRYSVYVLLAWNFLFGISVAFYGAALGHIGKAENYHNIVNELYFDSQFEENG